MRDLETIKKKMTKTSVIDCHAHVGRSCGDYEAFGYPYCLSLEDLVVRMDAMGISQSVVMPFAKGAFHVVSDAGKEGVDPQTSLWSQP